MDDGPGDGAGGGPREGSPDVDGRPGRDAALAKVRAPAICLGIVGGLGILAVVFGTVVVLAVVLPQAKSDERWVALLGLALYAVVALVSALALAGSFSMARLGNRSLAIAGAVAAALSLHCTVLGMAVGVWCLVVLFSPEVKAAWGIRSAGAAPERTPSRPAPPAEAAPPAALPSDPARGVVLPGAFMIVAGAFGVLLWTLVPLVPDRPDDPAPMPPAGKAVISVGFVLLSLLVAAGGVAMLRRRAHALAICGAAALSTCVCALPGIALAVWALVQLMKPGVREAFREARAA